MGVVAGFQKDVQPFLWRVELVTYANLRWNDAGDLDIPTQAHWLMLDIPALIGPVRARLQVGYADLNRYYYGIGNATLGVGPSRREVRFQRTAPPLELTVRVKLPHQLYLRAMGHFTHNSMTVYEGSRLAAHRAGAAGEYTQNNLFGTQDHSLLVGRLALEWDTRDHEVVPTRGVFHELEVESGHGLVEEFRYTALHAHARFFWSLYRSDLVLAVRALADSYWGDVPFYHLPYLGGPWSVRGVPVGRFRGKIRAVGSAELRAHLVAWSGGSHRFRLGAGAFVDTGRVWTDYDAHPELDGEGHGLKVGTGGGLRFQWGETLILRLDGAWSPDGVGLYLDIGQAF
jgi:outer membrane protein assembly factor BamA